ncbi:MAG: flagellar brake protein [Gammaproteobacteria bacterium]|nr:flagellar brake protein [Gammaproteobacteria bacterium]
MASSDQVITNRAQIVSLLRRLQAAHTLVSIKPSPDANSYPSVIVEVVAETHTLLVDAAVNAPWHAQITTGSNLHLHARLSGVRLSSDCRVQSIVHDTRNPLYQVEIPAQLLYKQRRRHYRAQLETEKPLPIHLPLSIKQNIHGYVVDISASGVCSRVDFNDASALALEQAIRHARIALPDQKTLTCDLALRSLRHYPEKGYSLIGSEFLHITPNQQHHVERLVASLDRTQRRYGDSFV